MPFLAFQDLYDGAQSPSFRPPIFSAPYKLSWINGKNRQYSLFPISSCS